MTREEILASSTLKRRFLKNVGLSMSVVDEPYFTQRLEALDHLTPCVAAFDQFCKELEGFHNEQDYLEYYNQVKESVIEDLKTNPAYQEFNQSVFKADAHYKRANVYTTDNVCDGDRFQVFISLDMKKANFSALRTYNPDIFHGAKTWEEYLGQFVSPNMSNIINSKYIRQVIMGACNPKKQVSYEKVLMSELLNSIVQKFPELEVYSLGEDEVILRAGELSPSDYKDMLTTHMKETKFQDIIRVTVFTIEKLHGVDGYKKKDMLTNKVEFKCVTNIDNIFVVKYYFGLPITEDDKVFRHEHRLAKFMEVIDNPFQ